MDDPLMMRSHPPPADDAPISLEADPHVVLERIKISLVFRKVLLVVSISFAFFVSWSMREDLGYFLTLSIEPTQFGDLRAKWLRGDKDLGGEHNTFVELPNMVPTNVLATKDHTYFLCPLFDVVVRTSRPLPTPPVRMRNFVVDPKFLSLLQKRRAFPQNLLVRYEGRGRLMRLDKAPRWTRRVLRHYYGFMDHPPEEAWLLLDGEEPQNYRIYLWIYFGAFALVALTIFFIYRALRERARLRQAMIDGWFVD
jgi:hypothetical protein